MTIFDTCRAAAEVSKVVLVCVASGLNLPIAVVELFLSVVTLLLENATFLVSLVCTAARVGVGCAILCAFIAPSYPFIPAGGFNAHNVTVGSLQEYAQSFNAHRDVILHDLAKMVPPGVGEMVGRVLVDSRAYMAHVLTPLFSHLHWVPSPSYRAENPDINGGATTPQEQEKEKAQDDEDFARAWDSFVASRAAARARERKLVA